MSASEIVTEVIETEAAAASAAQSAETASEAAQTAIALTHAAAAQAEIQAAEEVREVKEDIKSLEATESWQDQKILMLETQLAEVKELATGLKTTMAEMLALLAASQSSTPPKQPAVPAQEPQVEIPVEGTVVVQKEVAADLPAAAPKENPRRLRML